MSNQNRKNHRCTGGRSDVYDDVKGEAEDNTTAVGIAARMQRSAYISNSNLRRESY